MAHSRRESECQLHFASWLKQKSLSQVSRVIGPGYVPWHVAGSRALTALLDVTVSFLQRNHPGCKYPPAEPGALRCEPLKAADAFVAHAYFPFGSCVHERLCPTFASLSGNSGDFHRLNAFVSQSNIQKQKTVAYSRKCQTSTATPAEPGELPFGLVLKNQSLCVDGRDAGEELLASAEVLLGVAFGRVERLV